MAGPMSLSKSFPLILFFLACVGCTPLWPGSNRGPMHREISSLPPGAGCRIAVLPFLNDSDFPQGGILIQKVFAAQLQSSGEHLLTPEGDIVKAYQQLYLLPRDTPTLAQLRIIGDRLNAPLLLTGIVLEMREGRSEHQAVNPQMVLELELRDPSTGEILWTTLHRRKGTDYNKTMHFGTLHTVTGLSRQMAEEIINLWHEKGFSQCNE